jgi:lipid-A-disaccharide synthase-like uncharacterized protein
MDVAIGLGDRWNVHHAPISPFIFCWNFLGEIGAALFFIRFDNVDFLQI